jgi:HD-GYP domain-containing protein (c-di-GMP phosphodiesterase class II)
MGEIKDRLEFLEKRVEELTSLLYASQSLNSEIEIHEALHNVLKQMVTFIKAEAGTLWTVDEENEEIFAGAAIGPSKNFILNVRLQKGEGIVGKVMDSREPDFIEDVTTDPSWAKRVDDQSGFKTRTMMTIPLVAKGNAIGAIQLLNKQGDQFFTEKDVQLAMSLAHQAALALHNSHMFEELNKMTLSIIRTLATALDARDPYTAGHSERVSQYSLWIASRLGLEESTCKELERAALLHDIGKLGIPDQILLKETGLTDEEFAIIKTHTSIGARILSNMKPKRLMEQATETAHFHHERLNGTGYPKGLQDVDIPLFAKIVAVADSFDAMTTVRPYSRGRSYLEGIEELKRCKGSLYDAEVVDAFSTIMEEKEFKINSKERTEVANESI